MHHTPVTTAKPIACPLTSPSGSAAIYPAVPQSASVTLGVTYCPNSSRWHQPHIAGTALYRLVRQLRGLRLPTHRHACLLLALALTTLCQESIASTERVPLPPGYEYPARPTVGIPDPLFDEPGDNCHTCGGDVNGIRAWYKDFAGWRLNLDRYAGHAVIWEFLTFEHGFKSCWTGPQHAIRLYNHALNGVRVVTRRKLVVFEKHIDADGAASLVCASDDDWSIHRDGQRVVIKSPERWWAFETPDFGVTWRVVESSSHTFPFPVKLHYDGPSPILPSAIEYPDGARTLIAPAKGSDAVGKITLPNDIEYHIAYDPNGFPVSLEEYVPGEPKKELDGFTVANVDGEIKQVVRYKTTAQMVLTRRWCWENDSLGRVRLMIGPCGNETEISFASRTTEEGTEGLVIVTDRETGRYRYLRHLEKGAIWTIDRGHGIQDQPVEDATLDNRLVQRSIHHRMRTTASTDGQTGLTTTTEYDRKGVPQSRACTDADGNVLWERKAQPQPVRDYRHTPLLEQQGPCAATSARYTYRRGVLHTATYQGRTHTFAFDSLGRMRSESTPEKVTEWTYTTDNRVDTRTTCNLDATDDSPRQVISWKYDLHGRLKSCQTNSIRFEYRHSCEGVTRIDMGNIFRREYRYNSSRQLTMRASMPLPGNLGGSSPAKTEYFQYSPDGRVHALKCRIAPDPAFIVRYKYAPSGERLIAAVSGTIPPDLLSQGVHRRTLNDGSTETLGSLGTIIQPEPEPEPAN